MDDLLLGMVGIMGHICRNIYCKNFKRKNHQRIHHSSSYSSDIAHTGKLMGIITLVLVCTFFITSADSAVIVLGIFSENGTLDPSKKTLFMWGVLEGLFAIVLMIGSKDALTTMETLAIVGAFPFIFVEIGAAVGLTRGLKEDKKH